jgi:hypothetical protein
MPTFNCLDRGTHEISAKKVDNGIEVTLDGRAKTISKPFTPSAELLGNSMFFSEHEHCIFGARQEIHRMLEEAMR